jgi:hypothetical protein
VISVKGWSWVGQEIHGMADVVWPASEADRLRTRARHLADVFDQQRTPRTRWADEARDGWEGRFRTEWDASESIAAADTITIAARLRAMADALDAADRWVADENDARRRARDKEADDQTWFGLKDNVTTMGKAYVEFTFGIPIGD